jgi:hypothetical protein
MRTNEAASKADIPCPFLRALVAQGLIPPERESIKRIGQLIGEAAGGSQANKSRIGAISMGIAAIANGLSLRAIVGTVKSGLNLERLRGGPLDKKGVNSRIISQTGAFDREEFARLRQFARTFQGQERDEPGLGLEELTKMMDANFERAERKRPVDRKLMNGEWPVLLKVMHKTAKDGETYLALEELRALFEERKLPERIRARRAAARPE